MVAGGVEGVEGVRTYYAEDVHGGRGCSGAADCCCGSELDVLMLVNHAGDSGRFE